MRFKIPGMLWAVIFLMLAAAQARAEEDVPGLGHPVTQEWLKTELKKIDRRLAVLEKTQQKILEGQEKLSEEHKQLRYWIHKR